MDENKLIRQAAAGDEAAFEQLVLHYEKLVYNLALRMVDNEQDAMDMAQEAFLRAWRGLPEFQFGAQFSTWLYRLTSNICIDFLRAQKRRKTVSLTVGENGEKQWELEDLASQPEEQLLVRENRETLARAFAELDPEYRQILSLRIVQACSYQEIGRILGLRDGTVKSRLSRAREQLRKKLQLSGNNCGCPPSIH